MFDDSCVKHMGRTTYYQDTRADDTADSAGSGAIDDEDIPTPSPPTKGLLFIIVSCSAHAVASVLIPYTSDVTPLTQSHTPNAS